MTLLIMAGVILVGDLLGATVNLTNATPSMFNAYAFGGVLGAFTCANGVCTATYSAPNTAGTYPITVGMGGTAVTGSQLNAVVVAGNAAKLVITGSATQTAGASQTITITITAYDANGNVATGYTGAKSLTLGGASLAPNGTNPTAAATNLGTATAITFTSGVATASLVLVKVESALITATDGTISTAAAGDKLAVTVSAAAANAAASTLAVSTNTVTAGGTLTSATAGDLAVTVSASVATLATSTVSASPTTITADNVATSTITVQLRDAYNNFTSSFPVGGTGVTLAITAGTGTLQGSIANNGGGAWTQVLLSPLAPGSGTVTGTITGTGTIIGTATVTYEAVGGPSSSVVCTQSQSSGQNRAKTVTVNLCGNVVDGDMEIVTLGLDLTDDVATPTGWTKLASSRLPALGGSNKELVLVTFARRRTDGTTGGTVVFTMGSNHKYSGDMITIASSGLALPSAADLFVATSTTGAPTAPAVTVSTPGTFLYYIVGNRATGNAATPAGLTAVSSNTAGGVSLLGYGDLRATSSPTVAITGSKSANSIVHVFRIVP